MPYERTRKIQNRYKEIKIRSDKLQMSGIRINREAIYEISRYSQ